MERGDILRHVGVEPATPAFTLSEIERFMAARQRRTAGLTQVPALPDIVELVAAMIGSDDERQAARLLADAAQKLAAPHVTAAMILCVDDDSETFRLVGVSGVPERDQLRAIFGSRLDELEGADDDRVSTPQLGVALRAGRPYEAESLSEIVSLPPRALREISALLRFRGAIFEPLLRVDGSGWILGIVLDIPPSAFPDDLRHSIQALGIQAGVALEAVRLRQVLQRRVARAEALQGTARMLARSVDLNSLLERIAGLAAHLLAGDGAAVLTYRGQDGDFRLGAATGLDDASLRWTANLSASYLVGRAAGAAGPLQVTDASRTTTLTLPRLAGGRKTLAALCAPIMNRGEMLGAIEVYSVKPRSFSDDDIDLLAGFADQAAVAIQAVRTQEGRQRALLGAVEALASAVEARDGYTGEHCKQLVNRAVLVARGLGFSEREVETIGLAAALHDIGKIAVPDAILNKPGALTDSERAVVQRHPAVGEQIVSWVPELRDVARIIGAHQERYDGSGYPAGLCAEEIPLGARIIAVVDAYAAITENRPYRKGAAHEDAIKELEAGSGTQFDPAIIQAFIAHVPPPDELLPAEVTIRTPLRPATTPIGHTQRPGATGYLPVRRWQSRRASELAALNDILRAISSTLDLRQIYELVYRKISDLVDVDAFVILQAPIGEPVGQRVTRPQALRHTTHFPVIGQPALDGVISIVARARRSLLVTDYPEYAREHGIDVPDWVELPHSIIAAPILTGDDLLGLVSIQAFRSAAYDERHVGLIEEIALHIGLALRNAEVYAEARRRAEQFEAIGRLAGELNRLHGVEEIAGALASESQNLVPYDRCLIFHFQEEQHVLAAIAGDFTAEEAVAYQSYQMPRGHGLFWWAVEHAETLVVPDLSRDERVVAIVRRPRPGESGLVVPLIHEGKRLGVIFLARSGDPFSQSDAHVMDILAAHAATAISDATSHAEAQRRVRELEALQRAVAIVGADLERKTSLKAIVEGLSDVFGYRHVSLYTRDGNEMVMQAQVGYEFVFERLPLDKGFIARCVRTGKPILIPDVRTEADYLEAVADVRSEVVVPIHVHGDVVGALNVESGPERQLGAWDLKLIELFSQQVGVVLGNVSRYEAAVERATIDPVSQLPNHGALMERLAGEVATTWAEGRPLSLLFIDLDRFKLINDAFGHRFGDDVLAGIGRYLRTNLPPNAYIARYGGEEFTVLLPDTSLEAAERAAERLRVDLVSTTLVTPAGYAVNVSISVGVAAITSTTKIFTAEELIDAADHAMYEAKARGRNQVVRWAPGMGVHAAALVR
jgi:diguanylate cyclase (GGDEF)-like protein